MEISQLSATKLTAAIRAGELRAQEVTEHFLAVIEQKNPVLGAFLTVTSESALREARAADAHWDAAKRAGTTASLPLLHGVPLAHKDLTDVAGTKTTWGSAAWPASVSLADAPIAATLRSAGAISLGKTQVPEFGLNAYSENLIAPPARNPLDPTRTPGGSSGGCAAAVASGMLPFAPGSDGGGSVRIPALCTGLVGLKPGSHTIPADRREPDANEFGAPRLVVAGPLAHTAADAALLFDAMREDAAGSASAAVQQAENLRGLRIGISTASPFANAMGISLCQEAQDALAAAANRLSAAGQQVEDAAITYPSDYFEVFTQCWLAGLGSLPFPADREPLLTPFARFFRSRTLTVSAEVKAQAGSRLAEIRGELQQAWSNYDVILTPGLAQLPHPIDHFASMAPEDDYVAQCQWTPYTSMVNVSGLPAIAVPILRTTAGLSVGVHLIGRAGSETQLLQLAAQLMAA